MSSQYYTITLRAEDMVALAIVAGAVSPSELIKKTEALIGAESYANETYQRCNKLVLKTFLDKCKSNDYSIYNTYSALLSAAAKLEPKYQGIELVWPEGK